MDRKANISLDELCRDVPNEFNRYMGYVRGQNFGAKPDYIKLRWMFLDLFVRLPSLINTRGLPLAFARVSGSNTVLIQDRLMCLSVYPFLEHAKCQPGVGCVVQTLRWVAAGQMMSGGRASPAAEIHSTAVTRTRFKPVPRVRLESFRCTSIFWVAERPRSTPVSSIL